MDQFELNQLALMNRQKRFQDQQTPQQLKSGEMVSGHFVATNPLNYLAEAVRAAGARQGEQNTTKELQALQGERQKAMVDALKGFEEKAMGKPGFMASGPAPEGQDQSGGYQVKAQAPDMAAAYASLLRSPNAAMQGAAMSGLVSESKTRADNARQQAHLATLAQAQNPQQAIQAGVPPELVKNYYESKNFGRDKVEFKDTGGQLVPVTQYGETPTNVQPLAKTGNPFSDLVLRGQDGQMTPNAPLVGAKQSIAKSGASNVNVSTDKSYFGEVAQGLAKQDVGTIDAARNAPKAIETARSIKTLLSDPALITGTGANARLGLNKAFQTAGLIDGKTVANTEQLGSLLAAQTLDAVKSSGLGAGNGFTNSDREFLEKAKSGQLTMDVNTLRRIADMNEKTGLATIEKGNSVIKNLRGSGKMGNVSLEEVQAPAMQGFRIIRD